ncbi:MAG: transporter substrate-binding domain-containing protein [Rhizobiales bacterium]|nr:transporter substrate-binding domain-containing protein [Hyphomicrobiales bacterium]
MIADRHPRHARTILSVLAMLGAGLLLSGTASAQTLEKVKARGNVVCGVNPDLQGFSMHDAQGSWSGFDVDFCRALAAAIFNNPGKVQYVPLGTTDRLQALQSDKIDVLSRNTTWTFAREASLKLNFAAVTYYDGQGFLTRRSANATSALELDNASVCVQKGTTSELNFADFFRTNNLKYQVVALDGLDELLKVYDQGKCTVLTSDTSQLFAARLRLDAPDDHVVLPDIISKEPLGPFVRFGDDQWLGIVKWTHFAMVNAEELGVSSKTIDEALKSNKPDVKRLVGIDGNYGEQMGLTNDWAVRIIRHVGNYGEVFERNVGTGTKLAIPRGINSLWTNGGIQYAPPIR